MADAAQCADVRARAPEVAIGVAPVEDRARVLGHVAACAECRAFLGDLSSLVDDVVALAPEVEPPSGFESSVLARVADRDGTARRARWTRIVLAAAAVVVAATISGGAVYISGRADRELAANVRRTLAVAGGVYFAAFELVDDGGRRVGTVFGYQGEPVWVVVAWRDPPAGGPFTVELIARDGTAHRMNDEFDPAASVVWTAVSPIAVHDATLLLVADQDGVPVASARFLPP